VHFLTSGDSLNIKRRTVEVKHVEVKVED